MVKIKKEKIAVKKVADVKIKKATRKTSAQVPIKEGVFKKIVKKIIKPVSNVEIEPKVEVKAKIEPKVEVKAKIEPKVEVKVRPKLKPKSKIEVKAEPNKVEAKIEPKAEVKIEPKVEIKVEPKAELKVEVKVESKVEAKIEPKIEPAVVELKVLELEFPVIVKDLAVKLQEKSSNLIKGLINMGVMVTINQALDETVIAKICQKYGYQIKKALDKEELILRGHEIKDLPYELQPRFPIVTLMGHVDHGKTSLLDAIRKSKVVDAEHGGITQHIGAYRVNLPHGEITFLDTPGHEAFTAMRSRGASITDIVILVVACDDGLMPQTQEAIDHARAANVPIIVAINKIDKAGSDIERVKKQLSGVGLTAEDWGGKTIIVGVSAKTGQGIDDLLEMLLLEAQMLELKCNLKRPASGVIIEAKMSSGRGPISTLLIQNGTLHLNETIIVGKFYGKVKAMFNDRGISVTDAPASFPVEVLGISGVPLAGERFFVIEDEKQARELVGLRLERERHQQIKAVKKISLQDLHEQIAEGKLKELKLIIKSDVQGSSEAIKEILSKLDVSEVKLNIIHAGVGNINTSDVILAVASDALVLGFNVVADELAVEAAAKQGVDIKIYNIIYELANELKAAIEGMLEPTLKKVFLGRAEIRKVFKLSKAGTIAGCFVAKGKFNRNCQVTLVRNGQVVFEGKLSSLKRIKDDAREVLEGFECGMSFMGFDQFLEGDIIEAFEIEKIARKL
ncbi:MAG: translation initiation factor IF-2 [Candidatus Omnitrophota bacterium]|nr:translation initiation factor IF-2 [Candidatus Omnitrophota bacterium]